MFTARYELGLQIKQSALRLLSVNASVVSKSVIINVLDPAGPIQGLLYLLHGKICYKCAC